MADRDGFDYVVLCATEDSGTLVTEDMDILQPGEWFAYPRKDVLWTECGHLYVGGYGPRAFPTPQLEADPCTIV